MALALRLLACRWVVSEHVNPERRTTMARTLAAITLVTLLSSPASAEDGIAAPPAEPRIFLQARLELLPLGSGENSGGFSSSMTMATAYAISGSLEVALTRHLSIGVAPRLVFNVIEGGNEGPADKELDLRACIRARTAVSPGFDIYASFSPGHASLLSGGTSVYTSSGGYTLGGAFGFTYDVGSTVFVGGEIGFQRSFMRVDLRNAEDELSYDVELSYVHLGAGAGMRF
jgi:hypothetical protein